MREVEKEKLEKGENKKGRKRERNKLRKKGIKKGENKRGSEGEKEKKEIKQDYIDCPLNDSNI